MSVLEIRSAYADSNVWLFSQMKTGTTLICNVLAFYNELRFSLDNVSFNYIYKAGIGRGEIDVNKEALASFIKFSSLDGAKVIVHTHDDLPNVSAPLFIATTRDPLDYAVSGYHYLYKNRVNSRSVHRHVAVRELAEKFCDVWWKQSFAAKRAKNYMFVSYEDLLLDKEAAIGAIISEIYGELCIESLKKAIDLASVEKLKEFESDAGYAIVAAKGALTVAHFVRSGKIGEGKEFFDEVEKEIIFGVLDANNIPRSGALKI